MRQQVLVFLAASAAVAAQTFGIGAVAGSGVPPTGIAVTGRSVLAPRKLAVPSSENSSVTGFRNTARGAASADAVWKQASADEGLRQAFERATYSLEDTGSGTWRGENPAQRFTIEFNSRGARLTHPDGSATLCLTGYGYGDRLQKPMLARLTGTANRVEYQRGNLTEWYLNGSQGLEQGFTLAHRPRPDREGEQLVIALGVTGGLVLSQKTDENSVLFASSRGAVLRYAGLTALDARGRILPSRMDVRDGEIRLIVQDESAQYPLTIDPTWTQQQKLTASDGVARDDFGWSVAVSGETAVIGAYGRGSGRGAAYVFVRSGGTWTQQQELTASDGAANDYFGLSVAVSGETAWSTFLTCKSRLTQPSVWAV
jgi:hypothetical protein